LPFIFIFGTKLQRKLSVFLKLLVPANNTLNIAIASRGRFKKIFKKMDYEENDNLDEDTGFEEEPADLDLDADLDEDTENEGEI